jgi:transcriptional regulator with XRE-family HTH domain
MSSGVTFGQRLAEERERIGRTQEQLGVLVGASKRSVIDWEGDEASPKAVYLEKMAPEGIDVLYLLTGQRSSPAQDWLTPRQRALLEYYDAADEAGKRFIEGAAMRAMQSEMAAPKGKIVQTNLGPHAIQIGKASGVSIRKAK